MRKYYLIDCIDSNALCGVVCVPVIKEYTFMIWLRSNSSIAERYACTLTDDLVIVLKLSGVTVTEVSSHELSLRVREALECTM